MRFSCIQPDDWYSAFVTEANKQGLSLSEWMGERCRRSLPAKVQRSLSDRRKAGRPFGSKDKVKR